MGIYDLNVAVTFFSMVTSVILFQGLKASASQIITIVMAFLVICCGITILQMSKIDPADLGKKLDRRSTMLLQASRSNIEKVDEKDLSGVEDPGIDSIRGSFGPLGSMIRARSVRRMSQSSRTASTVNSSQRGLPRTPYDGLRRHQLYDAPVPVYNGSNLDMSADQSSLFAAAGHTPVPPRTPTIKFGTEEVVHRYPTKGTGSGVATHEQRDVSYASPGQTSFSSNLPPINEASSDGLPLQHPRPKHAITGPPPVDTSDFDYSEEPRTAPANLFASQVQRHDPFEMSPSTAVGPSFAGTSATQPLPQSSRFGRGRHGEGSDEDEAQAAWRKERGNRHKRASSERRYPRTGGDDDREESVSLVRSPSIDGDETSEDEIRRGGIRLVGPSPGRF